MPKSGRTHYTPLRGGVFFRQMRQGGLREANVVHPIDNRRRDFLRDLLHHVDSEFDQRATSPRDHRACRRLFDDRRLAHLDQSVAPADELILRLHYALRVCPERS